MLLAVSQRTFQEKQVGLVVILYGERRGLGVGVVRVLPAAHLGVELAQLEINQAIPVRALQVCVVEQTLGHGQSVFVLALLHQRAGQHQLQIQILGVGCYRLLGDLGGAVKVLGFAVGLYLTFVAAQGRVAPHVDHLLVGGNGQVVLVLFVVDRSQPLQEEAAIGLLLVGVSAVGV